LTETRITAVAAAPATTPTAIAATLGPVFVGGGGLQVVVLAPQQKRRARAIVRLRVGRLLMVLPPVNGFESVP
jgi:hypothetical protein